MTPSDGGKWHLPRAEGRAVTEFVVEVFHADGKTLRGISRLLDLSVSGACVDSTSDWNEGEQVVIRVLLNSRSLLSLPAEVVWKRMFPKTHHYGLKFLEFGEETRDVIREFVRNFENRLYRMMPKMVNRE